MTNPNNRDELSQTTYLVHTTIILPPLSHCTTLQYKKAMEIPYPGTHFLCFGFVLDLVSRRQKSY